MRSVDLIVNPAAGGGRCGKRVALYIDRLRGAGVQVQPHYTNGPGHAVELARGAAAQGATEVVAVGGDGTLFEVVNGLLPAAVPPTLGVLPLGTGNSFVRDLGLHTADAAVKAIAAGHTKPIDAVLCQHSQGSLHFINLLSLGFTAQAGAVTNQRFKALGAAGYIAAVATCLVDLQLPTYAFTPDQDQLESEPNTFVSFCNSQYTGGQMHMAPSASTCDGLLDIIRVGPMGRRRFLSCFPKIFKGTHVNMAEVNTSTAESVQFHLDGPVDAMIDGEIQRLHLQSLQVVPGAIGFLA